MKRVVVLSILLFIALQAGAAKVDTLYIMSASMHKKIPNLIITPSSQKAKERFPVLYLLHGAGGDFMQWILTCPELTDLADRYQMMIVCPDGGSTSWYFDSPVDTTMKYETYVSKELVSYIDGHYTTTATKDYRSIAGLSMGGHGAFYLAFRHQDIFGACGSMSGGVDIRPFPTRWEIAKRLGSYADHGDNWEKNTVINMLPLAEGKSLKIIFDCGTDDFFYDVNKKLHEQMLLKKIAHDYIERPGMHEEKYWHNAVKYQLVFFNEFFQENKSPK